MSQAQKKKDSPYKVLWTGLNSENRDFLYKRANLRVDKMLEQGLEEETKNLFMKYPENKILLNTIGYQELYPYLQGDCSIETAIDQLKQNTRRYIKRQISWFNSNKEINWFDIETKCPEQIAETIIEKYKKL